MMGMPFEGHSTLAYDNAKKNVYQYLDRQFRSGIMIMKGTWMQPLIPMTMTGTSYNPALGRDCNFREVFKSNR
jgi:hypothetical protein